MFLEKSNYHNQPIITMTATTLDHPAPAPRHEPLEAQPPFTNLSRLAIQFRLRTNVFVQSSVLCEFSALNFSDGATTAEAVLAALAFRRPLTAEGVLSVCLVRRRDGRNVLVELRVSGRGEAGHESIFLRPANVRGL